MVATAQTYGALLIGGMLAFYLSGIVSTQAFLYFRTFPQDRPRVKLLVLAVWFLDVLHSAFVCATVWYYLVTGLGNISALSRVHWSVGVTITITGVITFVIHCFFAYRVWTLSRRNIWITGVIVILSFLRTLSAFGTVIQLSRLHTWAHFHEVAAWSFTTGLVISACVDLLIAISIVYYLKKNRTGFERMDYIIDTIMVYTVENGMLTSLSVVASFICWLTMPHNFIFLALHFVITKMYANSLLATLNARKHIKDRSCHTNSHWRDNSARLPALATNQSMRLTDTATKEPSTKPSLQINVEKTVHCVADIGSATVTVDIDPVDPVASFEDGKDEYSPSREFGGQPVSSSRYHSDRGLGLGDA